MIFYKVHLAPPTGSAGSAEWVERLRQFEEGYFARNPPFAVQKGRHEFDGRLPDWSATGIRATVQWLHAQRTQAEAFDQNALSAEQRFERQYLLAQIDTDLFWLEDAEQPFTNPAYYLDSGLDPSVYLTRPYASAETRLKAFIGYARAVPAAAAQIRVNLRTPLPKSFIKYGVDSFGSFPDFYRKDAPKAFAEVKDPTLQAELTSTIEPAARAMQDLTDWLNSGLPQATENFALGPVKFADMLRMTERVTTPVATLESVGRADLARNLVALKQACAEYLPGAAIEACVAKVEADKPTGGRWKARALSSACCASSSSITTSSVFPVQNRPWLPKRPHTSARTSRISTSPVPTIRACPRYITSRHPIPHGPKPIRKPTCRESRSCCSPQRTKSGLGISYSSFTRTARHLTSGDCSSATRTRKVGHITPRR